MYVQLSLLEVSITLTEVLCFGNPIVATSFTGAQEQLQKRENGVVVNISAEDISNGVVTALEMEPINNIQEQTVDDLSKFLELIK